MSIDRSKYENAVLFLFKKAPDGELQGKKKLFKLLYFIDFDHFEYKESMESITGDRYAHRPMGPVPESVDDVLNRLEREGKISVRSDYTWPGATHPTVIYKANVDPDLSVFDADERFILDRVVRKYAGKHGTALESLTHKEAPWNAVSPREKIPYELAFYRGTDFTDAG